MHFRLGDYKLKPDCHPIMPFEYYSNSLGQLISIADSKQIFRVLYFCEEEDDDYVNSIISLLSLSYSFIEFIKVNNEIPDWKQLLIMSCCNDNIISNSSFSWWGAYFNDNVNHIQALRRHMLDSRTFVFEYIYRRMEVFSLILGSFYAKKKSKKHGQKLIKAIKKCFGDRENIENFTQVRN